MSEKKTERTYSKLGYSHLDTAEIITQLNRVLANQLVLHQKLRGFQWNITGPDFFNLHLKFKEISEDLIRDTDELAGRIRFFGQYPASTYSEYLKLAGIKEESLVDLTSYQMVGILLQDIRLIINALGNAMESADQINDNGTRFMLRSITLNLEKYHWKMNAWMKQDDKNH